MITNPKRQAFFEDLAALYAKHQLHVCMNSFDCLDVEALGPEDRFLTANDFGFGTSSDPDGTVCVLIPSTAHGRLAAVSRVASLSDQG
ncbi:MAG: hypothetical protein MEQ74_05220 [Paracoccus sp.]|nr:hypothetical protein [Paracoccus sp. (in: a-proteobacteria)]